MISRRRDYSSGCVTFYLVLCFVILCSVIVGSNASDGGNFATRIREISKDLDRQLQDVMASQAVNFTMVNTTGLPYNATTKFNAKGMGQLYNVTNKFIDLVQSKQAFPEGKSMIKSFPCIHNIPEPPPFLSRMQCADAAMH